MSSSYARTYGSRIPSAHVRAAQAILRCRTPEAGLVYYRCGDCGRMEAAPVSCGHRACNACGQHKAATWEARQKLRLLPVTYHLVTFTVPSEFRALFRSHQRLCYDLFFHESAGALSDLAADPRHLGGQIGLTGVLQTWTRDLRYHPHIHYLVPGGAVSPTGWVRPKNPDVLVPAKPLPVRMRNRFRNALKAADFKLYLTVPSKAWAKPWNVDARPVGSGAKAFEYIARYVQKTALDSARILEVTTHGVTIAWTDRESAQPRTATLTGEAFLHRFLQHVPPRGFVRLRHFGYLSAAARDRYQRLRALLRAGAVRRLLPDAPARCCPGCGADAMQFLFAFRPGQSRAPPLLSPCSPTDTSPQLGWWDGPQNDGGAPRRTLVLACYQSMPPRPSQRAIRGIPSSQSAMLHALMPPALPSTPLTPPVLAASPQHNCQRGTESFPLAASPSRDPF